MIIFWELLKPFTCSPFLDLSFNTNSCHMAYSNLNVFCASLGGLLFGYHTAIVNGAMLQLSQHFSFPLDSWTTGFIVSIGVLGALVGSVFAGHCSDRYGRRRSILLAVGLFLLGSPLSAVAWALPVVYCGRFVLGLGVGLVSVVTPVYLSEISPPGRRGRLVTLNVMMLTGGQFIACVVALLFVKWGSVNMGWRLMFSVGAVPAVTQLILSPWFLPESDRWLDHRKRQSEMLPDVLTNNQSIVVSQEGNTLSSHVDTNAVSHESGIQPNSSTSFLRKLVFHKELRKRVLIGCGIQALQQLSGINTLMYYSATILRDAGFSGEVAPVALSIPLAFTNALFTYVGVHTIDHYGRVFTCLISLTGCFVSIAVMVAISWVPIATLAIRVRAYVYLGCLLFYLMSFAPGMGPVPWVVTSEIFPQQYRGGGMALSTTANWITNTIVSQLFPVLLGVCGLSWTFVVINVFVLLAIAFVWFFVPETKGRTLEEIETSFHVS